MCVLTNFDSQTTNIHGDINQTITTTNYEQQTFGGKSDWCVRAISATRLALCLQHIYISNDDIKGDAGSFTYVVPKNIPCTFITTFNFRTQVAPFLYGVSLLDGQVEEMKTIA